MDGNHRSDKRRVTFVVRHFATALLVPALLALAACRSGAPGTQPAAGRPAASAPAQTEPARSPVKPPKKVERATRPKIAAPAIAAQKSAAAPKLPEVASTESVPTSEPEVPAVPEAAPTFVPSVTPTPPSTPAPTPAPSPEPAAVSTPSVTPSIKAEWREVLSGKMNIDFGTRQDVDSDGNPNPGAEDRYTVNLTFLNSLKVGGTIKRKPRILSSVLGRETQAAGLTYDLKWQILSPSGAEKTAGTMSGAVPIDSDGVYLLSAGNLKLIAGSVPGLASSFGGKIVGKKQANRGVGKLFEYARVIGGKKVKLESNNIDPLDFQSVAVPEGPGPEFPAAEVSGRFDYDYDTGNWLTNGFRFQYVRNGERFQDEITGSVRWSPDSQRELNGRGKYEFNLRYNETWAGSRNDESVFFAETSDEELFFAVDDDIPTLGGTISYQDTFAPVSGAEPAVVASRIAYNLRANKLTDAQLMNFLKLWLLIVGPVNDE